MAKTIAYNDNQIAKGHDNYSGLTNIEFRAVGGNTPGNYLLAVDDLGRWQDGQDRVTGDGITRHDGYSKTGWQSGAVSYSQHYYLRTSILGGNSSGNVTIKTRRYAVPMDATTPYLYVIANAVMTLKPLPTENKYVAGVVNFLYRFDRIEILHEDKMKGTLYATGASTAQTGITTAAAKLTAFTTSGLNAGVTTSASGDSHTIITAADYETKAVISFTSDASIKWTFQVYVNAAAVGYKSIIEANATPDAEQATLIWPQAMSAADVVTIYVNSDEGGGADLTVVEAVFSVISG